MKLALSLCGGGSLGSYEIGAYSLLMEYGLDFDIYTGTSIGAINATALASEPFETISDLWDRIEVDKVMKHGLNLSRRAVKEADFHTNWPKIKAFLRSFLRHKGADISPLKDLISGAINPAHVKAAKAKIGIVTTKFPSFREVDIVLNDALEEDIHDYLLASSACFPIFPIHKFKKHSYVDGGYVNNLPIDFAFDLGADQIIAVLLHAVPEKPQHYELLTLPCVKTIIPSHPTGSIMDFHKDVLDHNRKLGYLDAAKTMGRYYGYSFAYEKDPKWEKEAEYYVSFLSKEMLEDYKKVAKILEFPPKEIKSPVDVFYRSLDKAGDALGLDYLKVYKTEDFIKECRSLLLTPELQEKGQVFAKRRGHYLGLKKGEIPAFLAYAARIVDDEGSEIPLIKTGEADPLAGLLLHLCRFLSMRHLLP